MYRIEAQNHKKVVLIHGIWTRGHEMTLLKRRLRLKGLSPIRFSYPSVSRDLEDNVQLLKEFLRKLGPGPVALLGHSYGGILACHLMARFGAGLEGEGIYVRQLIFIASPLNGSTLARMFQGYRPFRLMVGKSLPALLQGCHSRPDPRVRTLMIAGTLNIGLGMFFLPDPSDGVVALPDTVVPWLEQHVTFKCNHVGLLFSSTVAELCIRFLLNNQG